MEDNICPFCRTTIKLDNEVNIKLYNTSEGNILVADFIKTKLFKNYMLEELDSDYICTKCYCFIDELEALMIKCKKLENLLIGEYRKHKQLSLLQETDGKYEHIKIESVYEITQNEETVSNDTVVTKRKSKRRKAFKVQINDFENESDNKRTVTNIKEINNPMKSNDDSLHEKDNDTPVDVVVPSIEQKIYFCEICGKQYQTYSGFSMHRREHRNENKFKCEQCNKVFSQKINLQRHNFIHSGTYQYKCEECGKEFIHHTSYKVHMNAHAGIKSNQCDLCGMCVVSDLARHMRTHTQEKTHACPECGKMFAQRYNMRAHLKKMHQEVKTEQSTA